MRTTGARRPENAKKHNATAPKNTISRKDVERKARFTEANGLPQPVAKIYARKKPQVSRSEKASAVRPELQGFSAPLEHNAYRCGYYSHEIESLQACSEVPTPTPFCVSVHSTKVILEAFVNTGSRPKSRSLVHPRRIRDGKTLGSTSRAIETNKGCHFIRNINTQRFVRWMGN